MAHLDDRALLAVGGPDAAAFLDGLVTVSVGDQPPGTLRFGALLSPQGKVLFDFLIHAEGTGFVLDTPAATAVELLKRLAFYRLRAKVTLAPDARVVVAGDSGAPDPRHPGLPHRRLTDPADVPAQGWTTAQLDAAALALGIPQSLTDYAYGAVFPADVNMEDLHGVDFHKGCFVGQEVVARMKHRGTARWRSLMITGTAPLPPRDTAVLAGDKEIGRMMSSAGGLGLALMRIDRVAEARRAGTAITAQGGVLDVALPGYASFGWPDSPGD